VYPIIAPPTPERLEQDKKTIQEQFDKAFALMDQVAKDTDALKVAEQERTQKLDGALSELRSVIEDLQSANRRREDDAMRAREDILLLKASIPKAMDAQKTLVDSRLKEVNTELESLKTLITQRLKSSTPTNTNGYLRPTSGNAAPTNTLPGKSHHEGSENATADGMSSPSNETGKSIGSQGRSSPFNSSNPARASIPAWQLAMANKGVESASAAEAGGSSQNETTTT
jgi:peroxin-14